MAQSTWSADSYAWSGTSYVWSNDTYQETATIAGNSALTSAGTLTIPVTVTLTQVILSELNEEDTVFPRSLTFGTNVGMTGTGLIVAPVTATLATNESISNTGSALMPMPITLGTNTTLASSNNAIYPASISLASTENISSTGYKLMVESVTFSATKNISNTGYMLIPESITFAATGSISDTGYKLMPESLTFASTVNIPLPPSPGTTNWDLDTNTWSTATNNWGYSPIVIMPASVTMTQVILSELNEEDTIFPRSLTFGTSVGVTATGLLNIPISVTLDTELGDFKTNINFEESATFAIKSDTTSASSFLWNDREEDDSSVWIAAASGDDPLWSNTTEDTGTTWTKISDPDE